MPNQFNANGTPLTVGVEHLVIDNMGVSGKVYASPLLPLEQGNAGGWAFSVDEFSMNVVHNLPVNATFKGKIHVPIFGSVDHNGVCNVGAPTANDCFSYDAYIEPGIGNGNMNYHMTVNTGGNTMCANIWKAGKVIINSGSQIMLQVENGNFTVKATLSGTVKITEPLSPNIDVNIPNITFQDLVIQNHEPYFSPGTWGFPIPGQVSTPSMGGFVISISNINMTKDGDGSPALAFNLGVKITDNNVNLSATGGFQINGQLVMFNGRQRWIFKNFSIHEIDLDGSFPGVEKITGHLVFFEGNTTFGTGWRGGVGFKIKGLAQVTAVAQFGKFKTPIPYKYLMLRKVFEIG
jgi:hypothetical protein